MDRKKFNIYIVGDKFVGKSSFARRYSENTFEESYFPSIRLECFKKDITVLNQNCSVSLFALSGNERSGNIRFDRKRKIDAIIFMYDVTSEYSLKSIEYWFNVISKKIQDDCPKFLIGTKFDLENERKVKEEEGKKIAEIYKMGYFEVSSKSGKKVNETMESIIKRLLYSIKRIGTFHNELEDLDELYESIEGKSCCKGWFKKMFCCK